MTAPDFIAIAIADEEHRQGRPYLADPDHCARCAEVDHAWAESVGEIDDPGPSGYLALDGSVSEADIERIKEAWNARLNGWPVVLPPGATFTPTSAELSDGCEHEDYVDITALESPRLQRVCSRCGHSWEEER